jgi:hypothetical protein
VHWTWGLTTDGYRVLHKDVVLDSIGSAPFEQVPEVADRIQRWWSAKGDLTSTRGQLT